MINHIYENFLNDINQYRAAEEYWRRPMGKKPRRLSSTPWSSPWISTGSPDCLDGNPIFSAVSPAKRRGIRVIQHEPTSVKVEIQAWPDFVGGNFSDPEAIQELVISCALSEAAADLAMSLIRPWACGAPIHFGMKGKQLVASEHRSAFRDLGRASIPPAA